MSGLDPAVAAWLAARAQDPTASDTSLAGLRAHTSAVTARARLDPLPPGDHEDTVLPGAPPIPARVHRPRTTARAVVVYLHGGGWLGGGLDSHLNHARLLGAGLPATVVAVDYRLAPEHQFPAAFDDCLAATRSVLRDNAGGLPVLVAGDSAGGQLAASVAIACRHDAAPPAGQLLLSPVCDLDGGYADPDVNARYPSRRENATGFGLTTEGMARFTDTYLRSAADRRDWRASPRHAPDLSGVAPAVVHLAGLDPLRDEGRAYAARLRAAGVPVTLRCWPTLNHSFSGLTGVSDTAATAVARAIADVTALLPE